MLEKYWMPSRWRRERALRRPFHDEYIQRTLLAFPYLTQLGLQGDAKLRQVG